MRRSKLLAILATVMLVTGLTAMLDRAGAVDERILSYTVDPRSEDLAFYWKDDRGQILRSIQNLKNLVEGNKQKLVFAMNGGMYDPDNTPQGLFIQHFKTLTPLDTATGNGNFYLKPNGVFYLTQDREAVICTTPDFRDSGQVEFATQSGPMLVIDGQIHPAFREGSNNLHIRNGVGILPGNKVVFAISETEVNLHDFARYFQSLGCQNALYLDGFVSRMYLPEKNRWQTDGNFGVMIGVTE